MNSLKKIVLVFVFLFFYQTSFADCGHCFSIIKTRITYTNGTSETSNLKFFRQYVLDNNEIEPKANESIKNYFPKNKDSINLIDTIYQLENLPAFINKETIRAIALKDIKDIRLLEWTTIQGAGELPYLSSEVINSILNSDTLFINTKIFDVHDEIYMYTGTALSLEDFNVLIKESYNYADLEPSIIHRLKIDKRKNTYPGKTELNKAFAYYFKEINRKLSTISEIKINTEIDTYFQIYTTNLKKRRRYLECVLEYLNSSQTIKLEHFISITVENDFQKNSLLKEINSERTLIKNTIGLVKKLYMFKEEQMLNEEFYTLLKKENIIVLAVSWD